MQAVQMNLNREALPIGPNVVRFDFTDPGQRTYWMLLRRPDSELCFHDPGRETDLFVRAELEALTRVFTGRMTLTQATRTGRVQLDGPRELTAGFPRWLGLSRFAPYAMRPAAI